MPTRARLDLPGSRVRTSQTLPARAHNSDQLIAYLDHLAETVGDPKTWLRITTAFRLSKDPGASFALAFSLEAAMRMADSLGFGGLAHVTKARPIIQAVSAVLLEVPEQARLKLANAQFGAHRCSGSPREFPLLCCFTTEISDQAIVSRIVALRSFVLLGVAVQIRTSTLGLTAAYRFASNGQPAPPLSSPRSRERVARSQ